MSRAALVLFLFSLFSSSFSLHILFYITAAGKSHVNFAVSLVDVLHRHGHTTDFLVARLNPSLDTSSIPSNRTFVVDSDFSAWHAAFKHIYSPFEGDRMWNPFNNIYRTVGPQMHIICPRVLDSPELLEARSIHYDFALGGTYDHCGVGVFRLLGITKYALYSALPTMPISIIHGGAPELPIYYNNAVERRTSIPKSNVLGRAADLIQSLVIRWENEKHAAKFNDLFRSRYGSDFPLVEDLARDASIDFVSRHPLIDEARPITPKMKYIGGITTRKPKALSKEFDDILSLRPSTVLFAFGTMIPAAFIPERVIEAFVRSFKKFPSHTFLMKLDSRTFPDAPNVVAMDWLPQADLLNDPRVVAFLSHVGMNSFTEAAMAGKPMVALPLQIDQFYNAEVAVSLGIAYRVTKDKLNEERITEALRIVLEGEEIRDRSAAVARMLAEWPESPERILVESIQFAAKHENLSRHLTPVGADYSLFVQNGYDAFLLLVLITLSIIFIFFVTLKLILRLLCKSFKNPVKAKTK